MRSCRMNTCSRQRFRDGVCHACNNGFSKFESALAQELIPIRLLLRIPDRRGDVSNADSVAKLKDGEWPVKSKRIKQTREVICPV
jgi:hypothetical protein